MKNNYYADNDVDWWDELDNANSLCLGFIDSIPIYSGDSTWLACQISDKPSDEDLKIFSLIPF